jgi:ribonuclease III
MEEPTPLIDPPLLPRDVLSTLVGTKVKNTELYRRAFTHVSALKRYKGLTGSYETLEFMGDSVLGFVITKHLFDQYEKEQEGFLTKARTKMVRGKTLCEISKKLGFDQFILMDEKGIRNNWNTNANILEDVFEAFVGAVYLDLGMVYAKQFILNSFEKIEINLTDDNYKDQLMRLCQVLQLGPPDFELTGKSGDQFFITVKIDGMPGGCGFSTTKKQAEQNAAEIVLKTDPRFKNKDARTGRPCERAPKPKVPRPKVGGVAGTEGGDAHSQ